MKSTLSFEFNFIINLYIVTNFNLNFLSLKQIISLKLIVRKFKILVDITK
ncbi:hypothetical protein [Staphylococcus argenteus]|nr:hypothetical protein [Staphylococcus argenteus]MCG6477520.1 hypothetical protein [Staphylococcus argenteus]MCG9796057.1 hypothetical protein [Staphylococcus argenteus]MCG9804571.1 hypothetical protein [Staphylococcus argenteus]MCG9807274.1 hypothetical protein [Staphylococcus argenteus]MCG9812160.1 hypothetical protein [Staphylococcus argenteus]